MTLEGKTALVTGGASGLGKATCEALAEAGASVVVVDLDGDGAAEVASAVGGRAFVADVRSLQENIEAVAFAQRHFGGLDLVVLNAGMVTGCGIGEDFDLDRYRRAMSVNLDGVVFGTHASLPALRARGAGAIVAMASIAGLAGQPSDPIYAANKHAVVGLTRSLGMSLADTGIRYNAVCPAFAESPLLEPFREQIRAEGTAVIPAATVAETVLRLLTGDENGQCWFVQSGRPAGEFRFRGVPGPRADA